MAMLISVSTLVVAISFSDSACRRAADQARQGKKDQLFERENHHALPDPSWDGRRVDRLKCRNRRRIRLIEPIGGHALAREVGCGRIDGGVSLRLSFAGLFHRRFPLRVNAVPVSLRINKHHAKGEGADTKNRLSDDAVGSAVVPGKKCKAAHRGEQDGQNKRLFEVHFLRRSVSVVGVVAHPAYRAEGFAFNKQGA